MKMNWNTEHDQARKTMTHSFKKGVRVIINWKTLTLTIERYQRTLDVFPITGEHYTVDAHERLLGEVERITCRSVFHLFGTDRDLRNLQHSPTIYSR